MSKTHSLGQSLYEMVAAVGVIGIALFALVSLATFSLRNANFSKDNQVAIAMSQEGIEWLRAQRDQSWSDFYTFASTSPRCISDLTSPTSGSCPTTSKFRREALFTIIDVDTLQVTVMTSWDSPQGISDARVTTDFTSWR